MLAKNKKVTLKSLSNMLKRVETKEQQLVGARYTSNNLSVDIPISGVIDNLIVNAKDDNVSGVLYFRPVAEQVEALQAFRTIMETYSTAVFPDDVTELPHIISDYEVDRVASDTVISNIQEIPMEFYVAYPDVYQTKVTVQDKSYTQFVIEETEGALNNQTLVLVFATRHYDGETLYGHWNFTDLNKTEGLKLLQFLANGSVLPSVIASVTVYSADVATATYPLFKDYKLTFFKSDKDVKYLRMTCDTASVLVEERDIKKITIDCVGAFTYRIRLFINKHSTIEILLG